MMVLRLQSVSIFRNLISQSTICRIESRDIKRWVSPTLRELKRRKDRYVQPNATPRSAFLEWNFDAELYAFGKRLNETFDKTALQQALTNRSYLMNEESSHKDNNSTFIRNGEEFMQTCVKQQVRNALPKCPADGVDAICTHLTTNEALADVALHLGLKHLILCAEYPPDTTTVSDTFKAVIFALLRSSGEQRTSDFIHDFVVLRQLAAKDINEIWNIENPLEMLTQLLKSDPEPRLCNQSASNTILSAYQIGLYVEKMCVGLGWGESIAIATEMAAKDGLKRIFGTTDSMPAISQSATAHKPQTYVHN